MAGAVSSVSTSSTLLTTAPISPARRTWTGIGVFLADQARAARRTPVTIGLVIALWVTGALTGSLRSGPSPELLSTVAAGVPALRDGNWWTPLTSAFFAADLLTYLLVTALLLVVGGVCERRWGSVRMLWMTLLVQVVGVALGVGVVALSDALFSWLWAEYLADSLAIGATALIAGLLMALSGELSTLWRRRIRTAVLTLCLVALLYGGQLQDVLRLSTALVGLLAGALLLPSGEHKLAAPVSRRETRVLVAVVVAATAVGPILVAITGAVEGPLSALADLYVGPNAFVGTTDNRDVADIVMSLVPALTVLVLAAGLRRGRRFAWGATVLFHVLFLALGTFYAIDYYRWAGENDLLDEGFSWVAWLVPLVLLPVLIIVLLLVTCRSFTVRAPAGVYRRLGIVVLGLTAVLWVLFAVLGSAFEEQFSPRAGFVDLLRDFPIRLLPNGYLYIIEPDDQPVGAVGRLLVDWLPVLFWGVLLFGLLRSFVAARVLTGQQDRPRARAHPGAVRDDLAVVPDHLGRRQLLVLGRRRLLRGLPGGRWRRDHHRRSRRARVRPAVDGRAVRCLLQHPELDAVPVQHHGGRQRSHRRIRLAEPAGGGGNACCRWAVSPSPARSSRTSGPRSAGPPRTASAPNGSVIRCALGHQGSNPGDFRGVGVGQSSARDGFHPRRSGRAG